MKRPQMFYLELRSPISAGEIIWENEPTLIWPNWTPPRNTYTVPGPRRKQNTSVRGEIDKNDNPLGVGTGLPVGLETPRLRLDRAWPTNGRPSISIVGQRDLLIAAEPVWRVLEQTAPNDVEGIEAIFYDRDGNLASTHYIFDVITFRKIKQDGEKFFATSPDAMHDNLGGAKFTAPVMVWGRYTWLMIWLGSSRRCR